MTIKTFLIASIIKTGIALAHIKNIYIVCDLTRVIAWNMDANIKVWVSNEMAFIKTGAASSSLIKKNNLFLSLVLEEWENNRIFTLHYII